MPSEDRAELEIRSKKQQLFSALKRGLGVRRAALVEIVRDEAAAFQPFPLNPLQEAYWMGESSNFALGNVRAHFCNELEFLEPLDPERLQQAMRQLIARHEMLRAVVRPQGEWQVSRDVPPYRIDVRNLEGVVGDDEARELARIRRTLTDQGPTTAEWPLVQTVFCVLEGRRTYLFLNCSLLLFDGQSFHIFLNELSQFYERPGAELRPIGVTYRDYALKVASLPDAAAKEYWWRRLDDLAPAPDLPVARDPASVARPDFVHRSARMDADTWSRLKQKARDRGVTPTNVLLGVFSQVLGRWSGNAKFTINVMYLNRMDLHADVKSVVGNMSTTVLVETDTGKDQLFTEYLVGLWEQLWRDFEHSSVHGVEIVRELNRRAGGAAQASFPVIFASTLSLGKDHETHSAGPWMERIVHNSLQTPQVWMDMQVHELNGALIYNFDTVESLFPAGLVEDVFRAYGRALAALAADDRAWQKPRWPVLSEAQIETRAAANRTETARTPETMHDLVLRQSRRVPQKQAVAGPRGALTYGELAEMSDDLARHLVQRGARRGELVAIVLEKGREQAIAALGVLRAGAAYLPISPSFPPRRIQSLLEQGEVRTVVTSSSLTAKLALPPQFGVVCVDLPLRAEPARLPVVSPEDLAYVIFTSGSTGTPKGVMITHRAAVNTLVDINERFGVSDADAVFAISEMTFDLSVYDLFGTLSAGGTIVFPDPDLVREPGHWCDVMNAHAVTVWNSAPSLATLLADHSGVVSWPRSLRLMMLSGDWIPVSLPDTIRRHCADLRIVSLGGATEAAIWSIFHEIDQVDAEWKSIPYGKPLANQKMHVLDAAGDDCPVWKAGDLFIEGEGLALGYWRDPEKTNAAFVIDTRGRRLYRTGDLGRYRPDGTIEFLGRTDAQVKINGFRIECGEIEAALERNVAVKSAVVVAVGERDGDKRLLAYCVRNGERALDHEALRAFVADMLPAYMVPHELAEVDALPLTHNGKVDRAALKARAIPPRPRVAACDTEPLTTLEVEVGAMFAEALGGTDLSRNERFFEKGGTSVQAVRLLSRLQKAYGVAIGFSAFLANQTVEGVSRLVGQSARAQPGDAIVAIRREGDLAPIFCVHPVGGSVFKFLALSRALGARQPLYAFQSCGIEEGETPLRTVEAMAEYYIRLMRAVQPHGPFTICGYSFGGIVAFEMARQIVHCGETIARLVLLDSAAPSAIPSFDLRDGKWLRVLAKTLRLPPDVLDGVSFEPLDPAEQIRQFQAAIVRKGGAFGTQGGAEMLERLVTVHEANYRAMLDYRPAPCAVKTLVVRAGDETPLDRIVTFYRNYRSPDLGWSAWIGGPIRVECVRGDHESFLEPANVDAVAEVLRS